MPMDIEQYDTRGHKRTNDQGCLTALCYLFIMVIAILVSAMIYFGRS